ncbi:MAG: efflux RND transporter periplasmic adaptor subunit [Sediminibacterium sp.]
MKKFYIYTLLFASLVACKGKKEEKDKGSAKPAGSPALVDVLIAVPEVLSNTVEANGTVVAQEWVELRPEVQGRLTYLQVPEGTVVNQGTVIARINDADLQAQMNKTRVLLDLAQKTEARIAKLIAVGGINQADYDAALNQVNSLKADLAFTQSLIDKTVVRAPYTGLLGLRQVSPGAYVTPSTVIATLQQVDKMKVDFTVPEKYAGQIKKGVAVEVQTDLSRSDRRTAIIIATEPQINSVSRNLKVRAVLQGARPQPGSFVKVYLTRRQDQPSILVPTNSIIPDDKNKQVILVKEGNAMFTNVTTGIRTEDMVEVLSGIKKGDSVVVTGVLFCRPKSPVKIRGVKTVVQLKQ